VHPEDLRDLAGVRGVVCDEAHQYRLARMDLSLSIALSLELDVEHRGRPFIQQRETMAHEDSSAKTSSFAWRGWSRSSSHPSFAESRNGVLSAPGSPATTHNQ